jgi:hypothetical protein
VKILGVSNPRYVGVTVATKSYCTHHLAFDPLSHSSYTAAGAATHIIQLNPDLVIIGGWSPGYDQLATYLGHRHNRKFPVVAAWHGTHFHETYLKDWNYMRDILHLHQERFVDYLAFPQLDAAAYFHNVKEIPSFFLPHVFPIQKKAKKPNTFTVGLMGGKNEWKNYFGQKEILTDFQAKHHGTNVLEVHTPTSNQHEDFLKLLGQCSVLSHLSILDCYPNVVLEAWSMGIPTVLSPASACPINNDLVTANQDLKEWMRHLVCSSSTNAYELYQKLEKVMGEWEQYSSVTYAYYQLLHRETQEYLRKGFKELCASFTLRKTQSLALPTTFTRHLTATPKFAPDLSAPTQITETGSSLTI